MSENSNFSTTHHLVDLSPACKLVRCVLGQLSRRQLPKQTSAQADTCPGRQLPSVFYFYLGSLVQNVVLGAVVALGQLSYLVSCLT